MRKVLGGGEKEEDIMGDFPPCLHCFKHLHLVFSLTFPHKVGPVCPVCPVCPDAAQEARSDVGKTVMVVQGHCSSCGGCHHSLEGKSGCLGIPASLSLDVTEVGGSDVPPAAQCRQSQPRHACRFQPPQVR